MSAVFTLNGSLTLTSQDTVDNDTEILSLNAVLEDDARASGTDLTLNSNYQPSHYVNLLGNINRFVTAQPSSGSSGVDDGWGLNQIAFGTVSPGTSATGNVNTSATPGDSTADATFGWSFNIAQDVGEHTATVAIARVTVAHDVTGLKDAADDSAVANGATLYQYNLTSSVSQAGILTVTTDYSHANNSITLEIDEDLQKAQSLTIDTWANFASNEGQKTARTAVNPDGTTEDILSVDVARNTTFSDAVNVVNTFHSTKAFVKSFAATVSAVAVDNANDLTKYANNQTISANSEKVSAAGGVNEYYKLFQQGEALFIRHDTTGDAGLSKYEKDVSLTMNIVNGSNAEESSAVLTLPMGVRLVQDSTGART